MTNNRQRGFTIIELTLAMGFITALLLGVALTVVQIGRTYNKGITLTEVNQSGRSLSSDLSSTISQSGTFDVTKHFKTNAYGGRICAGNYSYLWNTADGIKAGGAQVTHYQDETQPISLIKVRDTGELYCAMNPSAPTQFSTTTIPATEKDSAAELLRSGDRELNVYQVNIALSEQNKDALSGQELYLVTFTIGSGSIDSVNDTRTACKPPSEPGADPSYCKIQQFELVIRAGNGVN